MKRVAAFWTLTLLLTFGCRSGPVDYPETRRQDFTETLHGVEVADPYRWLEDLDSEETHDWVARQNKVTLGYLETLPRREELDRRLTELWNYARFGVPRKEDNRYFFTRNDGLQNQSVIYFLDDLQGEPVEVLDPNGFSDDGTVALTGWKVSPDGKWIAYGTSSGGSDWQEWKIRAIDTREDPAVRGESPDGPSDRALRWIKFSDVSWKADSSGLFYSRYAAPSAGDKLADINRFHKIYFHRIGTPQSEDELVYERNDQPDWLLNGSVTDDGRYLVISVSRGTDTRNGVFYKDLRRNNQGVVELLAQFDASYSFVGNEGSNFWFRTDLEAPKGKLVEIALSDPQRSKWKTLVGQTSDTLQSVSVLNNQFVLTYLQDAHSKVQLADRAGKPAGEIELPALGSVGGFTGRPEDRETFFSFTSFNTPGAVYRYDFESAESEVFRAPELPFNPEDYVTEQAFYTSKDGTQIPIFLTHRRGLEKNGRTPTLLYGYGGFNISITPSFSVPNLVFMEAGGIYAVANLRGGGEYGEEWHQGGMKANKQNVFDDFISAAEWLIEQGLTSPEHLGIEGASNGGLLVGACLTQRPELFGAAIPRVGVLDMLRFHQFTIGWAWVSDYGSPDVPTEFQTLYAYSPYHNVQEGLEYPATLIMTADHDDRVVPAHSFKFAAALQAAQAGGEPVLIRIETRAGHGAGKPTAKQIEEARDKLAFLLDELAE